MTITGEAVLTATDVSIEYEVDPPVRAVRGASITLHRGEILGLAGESGCGKTTLAYGPNRLLKAPAVMTGGEVVFHDASGRGYRFVADQIIALDKLNPQTAARMIPPLGRWRRFDADRQAKMRAELERILATPDLSKDLFEQASKSLES